MPVAEFILLLSKKLQNFAGQTHHADSRWPHSFFAITVFAMKNVMPMSKYIKSMFLLVALCCLCACGDAPDCTNPEANMSVAINADGTASNGAVYSQIDATRFMLDFVKYEIDGSHLKIIGYDNDNLPEAPKLYAAVTVGGKTYKTRMIMSGAFVEARMTSLVLPETLTSIGESAFLGCYRLRNLYIPEGVEVIGRGAFRLCSLLRSFDFPEALTTIDEYTFYACQSLEELHLPKRLKSVGYYAFGHCKSLRRVYFHEGLETVGVFAFRECFLLQELDFPNTLTSIGEYSFLGCMSLNNISFSKSLTTIGDGAFYACRALQSVEFPESLTNISSEAFMGCDNLKTVKFWGMTPPKLDYDTFFGTPKAYVRPDARSIYEAWTYRKCFSEILPIE